MVYRLSVAASSDGGALSLVQGQTDLVLAQTLLGQIVYTTTGSQGGILARDPTGLLPGAFWYFGDQVGRPGAGRLELAELGGRPVLISYGSSAGATLSWLDLPLPLAGTSRISFGGGSAQALTVLPLAGGGGGGGGGDLLALSEVGSSGISLWKRAFDGTMTLIQTRADAGPHIADLDWVQRGGQTFLLALSTTDDRLTVYRIDETGQATPVSGLSTADGVGISDPVRLTTVKSDGKDFVLIGSAGSSSVTVAELGSDGQLTVRDQVNDDLRTRFGGLTVLETLSTGGRTFVVAGGADSGLTAMLLLPDGRLLHLATIADGPIGSLALPVGLALEPLAGGGIAVLVADGRNAGVTRLHLEVGAEGPVLHAPPTGGTLTGGNGADLLIGGAGNDILIGGASNDILVAGAGSNRLTGGSGADLFVFSPGIGRDVVTDFQPGIDRLDLSFLGRIYSTASLDLTPQSNGILIRFGQREIELVSAGGTPITEAEVGAAMDQALWHVPVMPPGPYWYPTTDPADLAALSGPRRDGSEGSDVLIAGEADPVFDRSAASVYRIYQATLGRAPDPTGLGHWAGLLTSGEARLPDIASGFMSSPEFRRNYGTTTDAGFVTLLYQNVLGRAPDESGLAYWLGRLTAGEERKAVVTGFSDSPEFVRATSAAALGFTREGLTAKWTDESFRLYLAVFDRAPDEGGLEYWAGQLAQGRSLGDVAAHFIRSPEFITRYGTGTSNEQFVTLLYRNVLGREPDSGGLAHWLGRLEAGMGRASVVTGMSESPEFVRGTAPALIDFMRSLDERNRFEGGPGSDILAGGFGPDRFVFALTDGPDVDRVAGLERWDRIDLRGFGLGQPSDALSLLRAQGPDTVLEHSGYRIIFEDISPSAFTADMFLIG